MGTDDNYRVVARKYRPTCFSELVGQSRLATALGNAIDQDRVGHAYLFTGARGVGKTSSARIFAKCLNCVDGPTRTPCDQCDICEGVALGDDVDVLEIDGASNNGVEEVRRLRSNANVRPGRARYKIYVIDEVHMLSTAAFNALLKTLEEPPAHVKFIFCTTNPEKIPVTVLSRCQRYDLPPIRTAEIADHLRHIVERENVAAEDAALELLARRAGGSMRDSQSLLEQLLSFASGEITVADVHHMLGTADNKAIFQLANAIASSDPSRALATIDGASQDGVDAGQMTEQLLGLFRDVMARKSGCGEALMLHTSGDDADQLESLAGQLGIESVLAIMQVLDQTLIRFRNSTWPRTMLESAVVRCCHLNNLDQIPRLIEQLQSGQVAAPEAPAVPASGSGPALKSPAAQPKKKERRPDGNPAVANSAGESVSAHEPRPVNTTNSGNAPVWHQHHLEQSWRNVLAQFNDLTAEAAGNFDSIELRNDQLLVTLKSGYDQDICGRPEPKHRLEQALASAAGKTIRLDFRVSPEADSPQPARPAMISTRQRIRQMEKQDFVRVAMELFEGEIENVKPPPKTP